MDVASTLVMVIVAVGIFAWMSSPKTGQAIDNWASGFIGYRHYGWPRGVQEEDSVHFSFVERRDPVALEDDGAGPVGPDAEPEIVELETGAVVDVTRVR
jgi:hypothetical protein